MEINKTVIETIKTADNEEVCVGSRLVYKTADNRDMLAEFSGIEKGKLVLTNLTDCSKYKVMPKAIVELRLLDKVI